MIYKKIICNEKGMALMTAFFLGLISIGMIGGVYFAMMNSTRSIGFAERYARELAIARGVSDYIASGIMQGMINEPGGIKCTTNGSDNVTCSSPNDRIKTPFLTDIGKNFTDVNATFLSFSTDFYAVRVRSANPITNEKAEIDFVMSVF